MLLGGEIAPCLPLDSTMYMGTSGFCDVQNVRTMEPTYNVSSPIG